MRDGDFSCSRFPSERQAVALVSVSNQLLKPFSFSAGYKAAPTGQREGTDVDVTSAHRQESPCTRAHTRTQEGGRGTYTPIQAARACISNRKYIPFKADG